jgi:hypothetical protein
VITIGDDLARGGPLLLDAVQETVRSHVLPSVYRALRIELSSFKNDPVLVGVGTLVVEKVLQDPSSLEGLALAKGTAAASRAEKGRRHARAPRRRPRDLQRQGAPPPRAPWPAGERVLPGR